LSASKNQLEALYAKANAQSIAASNEVCGLMYAKADDVIAAHPDIEARIDQEIKDNRWDLFIADR
jgi:endonuclease III